MSLTLDISNREFNRLNYLNLKYQRYRLQRLGFRKFEIVAMTQFLCKFAVKKCVQKLFATLLCNTFFLSQVSKFRWAMFKNFVRSQNKRVPPPPSNKTTEVTSFLIKFPISMEDNLFSNNVYFVKWSQSSGFIWNTLTEKIIYQELF